MQTAPYQIRPTGLPVSVMILYKIINIAYQIKIWKDHLV